MIMQVVDMDTFYEGSFVWFHFCSRRSINNRKHVYNGDFFLGIAIDWLTDQLSL